MIFKKVNDDFYLKQLEIEDTDKLFELVDKNREYLKKWLPWLDHNKSIEDSKDFIQLSKERFEGNKSFTLGIWFKNQLAGVIGIHEINWGKEITAIGYWLGENFQGLGLVSDSVKFIVDYCQNELKLKTIQIKCAVENKKSRAIPENLEFKFIGINELSENLYGKLVDHAIYEKTLNN